MSLFRRKPSTAEPSAGPVSPESGSVGSSASEPSAPVPPLGPATPLRPGMPRKIPFHQRWLLTIAILTAAIMIGSTAFNYASARALAVVIERGTGDAFVSAFNLLSSQDTSTRPPDQVTALMKLEAERGLTYVAFYGRYGRLERSAGTPRWPAPTLPELQQSDTRLLMGETVFYQAPLSRPSRAVEAHLRQARSRQEGDGPPGTWRDDGPPPRLRGKLREGTPDDGRPGEPPREEGERFPPGPGYLPGGPPAGPAEGLRPARSLPPADEITRDVPPRLVVEFEPSKSNRLIQQAFYTMIISIVASLGMVVGAVVYLRIARRAEAFEAQMEHQMRLASLGQMSAVLAHELRNPLASLKGHAQLLEERLAVGSRERDKASRVVKEAVRIESLCTSLLDFVRSGQIDRQTVDPAELLHEATLDLGEHPVILDVDRAPEQWALDPVRIRQVLANLLDNARQASNPDSPVEASVHLTQKGLEFSVKDRGHGLPPEVLARLFEPFQTTKVRGVGLGLAVARRIVELHGGRITAHNREGGGAQFDILIPA